VAESAVERKALAGTGASKRSAQGMGKTNHKDSPWQGTGEVIRVPTQEHSDAADGVIQFLALLAYPHISEIAKRDRMAESLDVAFRKAHMWHRLKERSFRMRAPEDVRNAKNKRIQQQLNKWKKRVARRLYAGNMAARFYFKGQYLYDKPTSDGKKGVWIIGPNTITDALYEVVGVKEKHGVTRQQEDAVYNEKKYTWLASMPVLHLCVVLFLILSGQPEGTPFERFMDELYERPDWLHDALLKAEGFRSVLGECIPGNAFDPLKAVRMLPSESLPRI
jgi:hypothetical protein